MLTINRILAPVDFSEAAKHALNYATAMADRFGATVDVLHVWEPPRYVDPDTLIHMPAEPPQSLVQFVRTRAGRELEAFLAELERERDMRLNARLEAGDPAHVIIEVANKQHYDLVVMGTHGRTGLSRLLLGSVAEKVVRRCQRPVLTVRPPDPDNATDR